MSRLIRLLVTRIGGEPTDAVEVVLLVLLFGAMFALGLFEVFA